MQTQRVFAMLILAAALAAVTPARADHAAAPADGDPPPADGGAALGIKIGTPGIGGELTLGLLESLNLRGGLYGFSFSYSENFDGIDYDLDTTFRHETLLLDWHCAGNGFRITGGLFLNQNRFELSATPTTSVTIGSTTYPAWAIGTIRGTAEPGSAGPYIGVGYGNAAAADATWSFSFDLGVVFQSYDVALSADGPFSALPEFQADLQAEAADIQDTFDEYPFYPVLSFGIAYRFF